MYKYSWKNIYSAAYFTSHDNYDHLKKNSKLAATVSRIDLIRTESKVSTEYDFV